MITEPRPFTPMLEGAALKPGDRVAWVAEGQPLRRVASDSEEAGWWQVQRAQVTEKGTEVHLWTCNARQDTDRDGYATILLNGEGIVRRITSMVPEAGDSFMEKSVLAVAPAADFNHSLVLVEDVVEDGERPERGFKRRCYSVHEVDWTGHLVERDLPISIIPRVRVIFDGRELSLATGNHPGNLEVVYAGPAPNVEGCTCVILQGGGAYFVLNIDEQWRWIFAPAAADTQSPT